MVQALVGSGGEAPQRWGELEEAVMGPSRAVDPCGCHRIRKKDRFKETQTWKWVGRRRPPICRRVLAGETGGLRP